MTINIQNSQMVQSETTNVWLWSLVLLAILAMTSPFDPSYSFARGAMDLETPSFEGSGAGRQLGILALATLGLACAFTSHRGLAIKGLLGISVIAFIMWACISLTWIEDPNTGVRRLVILICIYAAGLGIAMKFDGRDIVSLAFVTGSATALLGLAAEILAGVFLVPGGGEYRFSGIMHPNHMGWICGVTAIAAYSLASRSDKPSLYYIVAFAVAVALLLLTKSRGAAVAAAVAILLAWFVGARGVARLVAMAFAISAAAFAIMITGIDVPAALLSAIEIGRSDAEIMTLTGRVPLWELLMEYVSQRPWVGYGWGGFWVPQHIMEVSLREDWAIYTAHSTWIHLLLDLGIVGVVLFAFVYLLAVQRSVFAHLWQRTPESFFALGVVTFVFVNMWVETTMHAPDFVNVIVLGVILRMALVRGVADGT